MFGRQSNQLTEPATPSPSSKPELWGEIYTMPGTYQSAPRRAASGKRALIIILIVLAAAIMAVAVYLWWRSSASLPLPPATVVMPPPATEPTPAPQPSQSELVTAAERDRARYLDVRAIQAALELYYAASGRYPLAPLSLVLGTTSSNVLSAAGFSGASQGVVYLDSVPQNPEPGGGPYLYESLAGFTYSLKFSLEEDTAGLTSGDHEATPLGIDEKPPVAPPPTTPRQVNPPPPTADADGDGLTNAEEAILGSDAAKPDSDSDGYTDGGEVDSGYDPAAGAGALLAASASLKTYTNERFGYSLIYPAVWQAELVDEEGSEVLFSSGGSEFIEVLVVGNPDKLSAMAWYAKQFTSLSPAEVPTLEVGELTWALSPEGLAAYLATDNNIITLSYNIGTAEKASYYTLYRAMIRMFSLTIPGQSLSQPTGESVNGG